LVGYNFKKETVYKPPEPMPERVPDLFPMQDNYLMGRNLSYAIARYNLWYPTKLPGPRVVVPCTGGFWQARTLDEDELRYRSSKGSRSQAFCIVWPKKSRPLTIVVEGPMDALAAAGLGAVGVASLGAHFGEYVVEWVCKNRPSSDILIIPDLDDDEFGYNLMAAFTNKGKQSTLKLPTRKDFAKMTIKEREKLIG